MKVHHIGYLVKNLNKAEKAFIKLGYQSESSYVYDEKRKVNIAFLTKDNYRVELIESTASDSIVANLYGRFKNAPYHMCYSSDCFEEDIESLREAGFVEIDEPAPAPALNNKRVVFFMNASAGIIELLEN